jgi:hypothetical protein
MCWRYSTTIVRMYIAHRCCGEYKKTMRDCQDHNATGFHETQAPYVTEQYNGSAVPQYLISTPGNENLSSIRTLVEKSCCTR